MEYSQESIKHLLFREEPEEEKFPIYRSKYRKFVREDVRRRKRCHATMGFSADFPRTPPENFLKKRTRMVRRPIVEVPKPPAEPTSRIPTKDEWYYPPKREPVDFVVKNIRDAVNSTAKSGPYRNYDTAFCRRVKHRVYCTPHFMIEEGFGKVPKYITDRRKMIERERKALEEEMSKKVEEPLFRLVPVEEREKLLNDLKKTWAEMQKEFQLLPMLCDTYPKIKRKEKLEKELEGIEKDIKLIENYKNIYVYDPDRVARTKYGVDPCQPKAVC